MLQGKCFKTKLGEATETGEIGRPPVGVPCNIQLQGIVYIIEFSRKN